MQPSMATGPPQQKHHVVPQSPQHTEKHHYLSHQESLKLENCTSSFPQVSWLKKGTNIFIMPVPGSSFSSPSSDWSSTKIPTEMWTSYFPSFFSHISCHWHDDQAVEYHKLEKQPIHDVNSGCLNVSLAADPVFYQVLQGVAKGFGVWSLENMWLVSHCPIWFCLIFSRHHSLVGPWCLLRYIQFLMSSTLLTAEMNSSYLIISYLEIWKIQKYKENEWDIISHLI